MDLTNEIEREHSRKMAMKVVRYVGNDPKRFRELINLFLAGPYRVTQRASWPLSLCVEQQPDLVTTHLNSLLDFLKLPGNHPGVKRNTLRMLQFVVIPKRLHGKVADICFRILQTNDEPVAIKVFAMSALARVVQHHPELGNELRVILEDQLPYGSPGYISRARKVLREISVQPKDK